MVELFGLIVIFISVVVVVGLFLWSVMIYNRLISLDRRCEKSWSNIDVLLKQRSDELPKLIDTAEEYMEYEEEVLQNITEARMKAQEADNPKQQGKAEDMLKNALGNLFAVAEDYPELRSSESFQQLQERISSIEEQIADRREVYNEAARRWNTLINQIPYMFIARILNMEEKEMFEATEEEKESPNISEEFNKDS